MEITHVVRGSEYLSSTPKYNILYNSFGWEIPVYIHLPLILNENKEKLSKRRGDANFEDLLDMGFLPRAIVNYIALLGWSPGTNREIFTLDELKESFHIEGVSKSPATFDKVKLTWLNQEYFKAMAPKEFYDMALPYLEKSIKTNVNMEKVAYYCQSRVAFIEDVSDLVHFIDNLEEYSIELFVNKKMKTTTETSLDALEAVLPILENIDDFTVAQIKESITALVEKKGVKNSQILWPIRTALSGRPTSFCGALELLELLGKEISLKRIRTGIERLN